MKIYLAGPMRGCTDAYGKLDFNFPRFNRAAAALRAVGYEVFNPAEKGLEKDIGAKQETLAFRRAVFNLDTNWICTYADGVALLPGWTESKGAKAEAALAEAIGIPARFWDHWILDEHND